MTRLLITATDQGDVLSVQSDFNDTATYVEMLKQASDLDHITVQPFPDHVSTITIRYSTLTGAIEHVGHDAPDGTHTTNALITALQFVVNAERAERDTA